MARTFNSGSARCASGFVANVAATRRGDVIGLCMISASLGMLFYGWWILKRLGNDYVAMRDILFTVYPFVCIPIGAIARIRGLIPTVLYTIGMSVATYIVIIILVMLPLLSYSGNGFWWYVIAIAAICPVVGLLIIRPTLAAAGAGMAATIVGMALLYAVGEVADALWPMRMVAMGAGEFATIVSFGPIMGLTVGGVATILQKTSRGDSTMKNDGNPARVEPFVRHGRFDHRPRPRTAEDCRVMRLLPKKHRVARTYGCQGDCQVEA